MMKILEKDYPDQNVLGDIFHFQKEEIDTFSLFFSLKHLKTLDITYKTNIR